MKDKTISEVLDELKESVRELVSYEEFESDPLTEFLDNKGGVMKDKEKGELMKSILVIDTPKDCRECPCFYDWMHCQAKDGLNVIGDERPNDCPLKPMPKRIPTNEYGYMTPYGSVWNACIEAILGEKE